MSRAGCLPCTEGEWLECRFIRPGRTGPGGGLGEEDAAAAEGMAAGVGWDVEEIGMVVAVAAMVVAGSLFALQIYRLTARVWWPSRSQ